MPFHLKCLALEVFEIVQNKVQLRNLLKYIYQFEFGHLFERNANINESKKLKRLKQIAAVFIQLTRDRERERGEEKEVRI